MKPNNRILELTLEINRWMKTDPNSKKLKLLFAERQELLHLLRVKPTEFKFLKDSEKPIKKKKPSKVLDFQKARAEKVAEEFSGEIKTGSLYEELRPKKKKV